MATSEWSSPPAPLGYTFDGAQPPPDAREGATPVLVMSGEPVGEPSGSAEKKKLRGNERGWTTGAAPVVLEGVAPIERAPETAPAVQRAPGTAPVGLPRDGTARLLSGTPEPPTELDATLRKLGLVGCCTWRRAALRKLAPVRELDRSCRRLLSSDGRSVAHLLQHVCSSLATLQLGDNRIGDKGAEDLAAGVAASGSLTEVNLRGNELGDMGWCAIFDALRDHPQSKITNWNLSGQDISPTIAKSLAAYVDNVDNADNAAGSFLGGNKIGDEGAKALAACVAASGSLTELDLRENKIGPDGAKALAAGVAASGSLTTLILGSPFGGNTIGDEGAKALADATRASGSLTELGLTMNNIGHKGATAIAEALLVNGSLAQLRLGGNNIGPKGAKAIAEALKVSGSLATLALAENEIGDEGAKALAAAVAASGSLALKTLNVGFENADLVAACQSKGVRLK